MGGRSVGQPTVRSVPQKDLAEQISQDGMTQPLTRLTKDPMAAYCDLGPFDLTAASTTMLAHRLGRRLVGWIPTDITGSNDAQLRRVPPVNGDYDDRVFLKLYSGTDVTVRLRVW